jgi:hypothetical protein
MHKDPMENKEFIDIINDQIKKIIQGANNEEGEESGSGSSEELEEKYEEDEKAEEDEPHDQDNSMCFNEKKIIDKEKLVILY